MKRLELMLFVLAVAVAAFAQTRSKQVDIYVTSTSGEDLQGQLVTVVQTDYDLTYEKLYLDTGGHCSLKVYPGNQQVNIVRDGYQALSHDFFVDENAETPVVVNVSISEKTREPYALKTTVSHNVMTGYNDINLTWNTEDAVFEDDFESYEPFAVQFGDWTGIDGDHLSAAALMGDYPNRNVQQYAQIINPLVVEPTWWYEYQVLRPYSGKQYVGFVRTSTGEANDDWLISPAMTLGTENYLSFLAKAADVYTEKFKVYVTTVTDNPTTSDFVRIDKDNYEKADYKGWKEYNYDLSEYAGKTIRFAIRYVSCYNEGGSFMLMLDDVYVGQMESYAKHKAKRVARRSAANPNEVFDLTLNGEYVTTTEDYSYTFSKMPCGDYTFGVKARYVSSESREVTTSVSIPASDYAHLVIYMEANSVADVNMQKPQLLSTADGKVYNLEPCDGKVELPSLPKGEYIFSVEEGTFQAIQQTINLDDDREVSIELVDLIRNPENITAQVVDDEGAYNVELTWNQAVGFTDSFEDYADFATGKFGEWTSIDRDEMPVYPIALGSASNIVSFPGSGTASMPTAIPPMVFNPYKTVPAMMPNDPAIAAPTGDKTVIFFSPQQGRADKWLISPEVTIFPEFELSVTAKSYTSYYPETIEFCVATEGDQPENFTVISNAENMPSEQWTKYVTPLDDYVGMKVRLAVHYISYDTFFAQIDDFSVQSAEGSQAFVDYGNIDHFNIFVDGTKVAESKTSSFTLLDVEPGNHTIGIQAVYKNGQSEIVEYQIVVAGIGEVKVNSGKQTVYSISGMRMGGNLPRGIYITSDGRKIVK